MDVVKNLLETLFIIVIFLLICKFIVYRKFIGNSPTLFFYNLIPHVYLYKKAILKDLDEVLRTEFRDSFFHSDMKEVFKEYLLHCKITKEDLNDGLRTTTYWILFSSLSRALLLQEDELGLSILNKRNTYTNNCHTCLIWLLNNAKITQEEYAAQLQGMRNYEMNHSDFLNRYE